jgi:hypothetical protein
MNKLIIIGNGFDRAHDLPTSYGHFLNYIWQNFDKVQKEPLFQELFTINFEYIRLEPFESFKDFEIKFRHYYHNYDYQFTEPEDDHSCFKITYKHQFLDDYRKIVFEFKNKLFELITVSNINTWVDIEKIYYDVLLSIVKSDKTFKKIKTIDQLNSEFLQIKNLLNNYLSEKVDKTYNFNNTVNENNSIVEIFENKYYKDVVNSAYMLEFPFKYQAEIIKWNTVLNPRRVIIEGGIQPQNLFLDFNYTSTIENYTKILNNLDNRRYGDFSHIQIHGKLDDDYNPINFGFGDEMDDHYKILEKTGDNRFLKNIKSFMYFNNSNYRKLLNWIEFYDYQIFIMGHSCGLSDRTLLNTLFEHNNCKSIKIFYHKYENESDNFTELTQNLSRHFNKKDLMREKVVDKSLSQPLPQNIRYKYKDGIDKD